MSAASLQLREILIGYRQILLLQRLNFLVQLGIFLQLLFEVAVVLGQLVDQIAVLWKVMMKFMVLLGARYVDSLYD